MQWKYIHVRYFGNWLHTVWRKLRVRDSAIRAWDDGLLLRISSNSEAGGSRWDFLQQQAGRFGSICYIRLINDKICSIGVKASLQFIQIHLSQANMKTDKKNETQAQMQKTMATVMPAIIAVFAASLPAGVGIYWAVSTLFGIGQQLIVNKSK